MRAPQEQKAEPDLLLKRVAAPVDSDLPLPRLLMVFAHPDDEVIAVGGRMERMRESRLLTVTDGAPTDGKDALDHGFADLEAYRRARDGELFAALAHAGLPREFVLPFTGRVPDQTAGLHLVKLVYAVAEQIADLAPEAVLTHPYEGGHPDHDACAFAVHNAVRLLGEHGKDVPAILEAPFYHAGENGCMLTGRFLSDASAPTAVDVELSSREAENKRARLACFASQAETLAQFGVERESFRRAPQYDFTSPPQEGQLLYERFGWGMTGEQFRAKAAEALQQLFPVGAKEADAGVLRRSAVSAG